MSLQVKNISYTYMPHTPFERKALQEVSFTIAKGERVAIIGHTGSGKSTLAEHLTGLLEPQQGEVLLDEAPLHRKGKATPASRVGMVFQYPEHQIFAETVYEDIAFGPRNQGLEEEVVHARVQKAMAFVGLAFDDFAQRSPFQLSGGQMRRVAIAGVVAMEPDYLIMDEPTAGLDPVSRDALFAQLHKLQQERQIAVILITHSMEEAATHTDRLLVMSQSKLLLDGPVKEIFAHKRAQLQEVGLDVPETIKLRDYLATAGLEQLEPYPLTPAELVATITTAKGWSKC